MLYAKTTIWDCLKNRQPVSNAQHTIRPFRQTSDFTEVRQGLQGVVLYLS